MKSSTRITPQRVRQAREARFNPIRGLEPDDLAQRLDQFRIGELRPSALTWDAMIERDLYLKGVTDKRYKDTSRRPWEVLMTEKTERAAQHAAVLKYFYNNLRTRSALDQNDRGGMKKLVRQMMQAEGFKYSVHEMVLKPRRNSGVDLVLKDKTLGEFKFRPDTLLTAEFTHCPLWWFENRRGSLGYLAQEFDYEGELLRDGEWLVTFGGGLMVATSVGYMFKHMSLKDWLNLSEFWGFPVIDAATDAAPDSTEWSALEDVLENFSRECRIIRSKSSEINLLAVGSTGDMPYKPMVDYMDRAIITLWRGGDLSTLSSQEGEGTGASLQGKEADILVEDDCAICTEALNEYVDRFVIGYLFDEEPLAYVSIIPPRLQNVDEDIKIAEFLLKHKASVGVNQMRERLAFPEPDEDDELLVAEEPKPAPGRVGLPNDADDLTEVARTQAARAIIADLRPITQRLGAILEIVDDEIRRQRLTAFLQELDQLKRDVSADPELAKTLNHTLAAALANGLQDAA